MNCEEFRAAVLAGEESTVSDDHLDKCQPCRSQYEGLIDVRSALAEPGLWEEPSPELGWHVESLITGAAAGDHGRSSSGTRVTRWAAAVAAAVVLLVAVGAAVGLRGPTPDWEVALAATADAPDAAAVVKGWNEDSGTRMVLEVEGLAPAPAGYMYEFWLSEGPLHISAGTFRTGGEIELWAAVRRSDFPRLWVTLEPIDEDESPSSTTVLDTGPVDVEI